MLGEPPGGLRSRAMTALFNGINHTMIFIPRAL
jgi:hypothetical protein